MFASALPSAGKSWESSDPKTSDHRAPRILPMTTTAQPVPHFSRRTAFLLLAISGCLWGTGFPLGKVALVEIGVSHLILYRLLFACLGLAPFLSFRMVKIQRKDWWMFLLTSFIGIPGVYILQFWGLSKTTVSHAALMVGTLPMLLALAVVILRMNDSRAWHGSRLCFPHLVLS